MAKTWELLCLGDVNVDLIVPDFHGLPGFGEEAFVENMELCLGGGAALTAAGCSRLGIRTALWSDLGDDLCGRFLADTLTAAGVDCSLLSKRPGAQTGITVSLTNAQDRLFLTKRGTNADVLPDRLPIQQAIRARHIHLTGYCSANHDVYAASIRRIRAAGAGTTFSMDPGWDAALNGTSRIAEIMSLLDIVFVNEMEAMRYTGSASIEAAADQLSAQCESTAVIKCGSCGALACCDHKIVAAPAKKAVPVDTTGAGDSFNAGFLYGYLRGASLARCLSYGTFCGAQTVQALGGNTAFPTEAQVLSACQGENT